MINIVCKFAYVLILFLIVYICTFSELWIYKTQRE